MIELVELLAEKNRTVATMESCTGGGVVNAITNVEGSSNVLKFSAVTYSNDFKIKFGVSKDVIEKYSVYSRETAVEMSKNIADFANADYGIGITGKLNRADENNLFGKDNEVFISIYDKNNNQFYNETIIADCSTRESNKQKIIDEVVVVLKDILKK